MTTQPSTTTTETEHEGNATDVAVASLPAQVPRMSPLDAALRGQRGRPQAPAFISPFDHHAPESLPGQHLDPANVTAIAGYDEANVPPALLSARNAFEAMRDAAAKVIQARNELASNPTLGPGQAVLMVADMQAKLDRAATLRVDAAAAALASAIATDQAALDSPMRDGARGPYAAELRAVLRAMPMEARMGALDAAIANGDVDVTGAALGAPPLLTGLQPGTMQALAQKWHRARNPQTVQRLAMMRTAQARLEAGASKFVAGYEARLGARADTVARLRAAKASAAQVMA